MRIGSLFSGIGGLELGLERSGLGHILWQVEQDEFCRGVLAKHWPNAERFEDVRAVGARNLAPVDLICGGFPCQDVSSAGAREGLAGSRSGLWVEFARIIGELEPRWVVVENVASGAKLWVDSVRAQLGQLGYETLPVPMSAEDVGAPHRRARIFIIAYSEREQLREQPGRRGGASGQGAAQPAINGETRVAPDTDSQSQYAEPVDGQVGWESADPWREWRACGRFPVSPICGVDDGVPSRMARLKALGNAVVPQCAEVIGRMIQELRSVP